MIPMLSFPARILTITAIMFVLGCGDQDAQPSARSSSEPSEEVPDELRRIVEDWSKDSDKASVEPSTKQNKQAP